MVIRTCLATFAGLLLATGLSHAAGTPDGKLSEIPPLQMTKGQCALVLWSREPEPKRIFAALDRPAVARIRLGRKELQLSRAASAETPTLDSALQTYEGNGLRLDVRIAPADLRPLETGAVVSQALLELNDNSGWSVVIPAAGLVGCQE